MVISHNLMALNAVRQLNITGTDKKKETERLSSGYRINRAADDAAGLAISEKMRRQIKGLSRSAENIRDGISLCNVADGALDEIHSILHRERVLIIQGANDTNSEEDKEYIQNEINQLTDEFDRIFDTADFNTIKLFKGKDTYLSGPTANQTLIGPDVSTSTVKTSEKEKLVWFPKGTTPTDSSVPTTTTKRDTSVKYYEEEVPIATDEHNHTSYSNSSIKDTIVTDTKVTTTNITRYEAITDPDFISDHKTLSTPKAALRSDGYLSNIRNKTGDLDLTCAMSQIGLKIDGNLVSASIYNKCTGTTFSADGNQAVSKYDMGNGIIVTQTVTLKDKDGDSNGDTYNIAFGIENNSGVDHTFELKFALDAMNTGFKNVNNGSTSFSLSSNYATIGISGSGSGATLKKAMLGDISSMYGAENWEGDKVTPDDPATYNHSGVGYWWTGSATDGASLNVGEVNYGPIVIGDPYYEIKEKEVETEVTKNITRDSVDTEFMPTYLDIQAGPEAWTTIPIRLWNLSSSTLHMVKGVDVNVNNVGDSLDNIDYAFEKVNSIRAYYGATTNRLEHAYNVNKNTEENTQAAESIIRDTDMAKTMVAYSNHNIIEQAGVAMLAQANQKGQEVLSLLS